MPREDLPFCDCRWLERAAHDPSCPVEFDPQLNEFSLKTANGGSMNIYHCPFCAGKAPQSLRSRLFAEITAEETCRLHLLTKDICTVTDLRSVLGEPTQTLEPGIIRTDAEEGCLAPAVHAFTSMRYEQHSDTAVIDASVSQDGRVRISFRGKYIGSSS